ncbi:MAG: DUF1446 domain-containing protein [Comamonadaceae bacterium]|nr:MAG: DUF1446 domain-containing protein [Comamonadaceae bacterium]
MAATGRVVRIGGASGFWGDSSVGAPQLVKGGQLDYIVFDYLAELTMSILAAARARNPDLGYATDFVTVTMKAILKDVVDQGIRVVSNAGGVNPQACAQAVRALADELGVQVKIAVVMGDDVTPQLDALRTEGVRELQSGDALPAKVLTANAYLGALPVKRALDEGAQIVITGRCVDSAVTLGALMHEFGWTPGDHDLLAQGSLAGHIIECGCQATGGLHTDWASVPDWAHIGYPVIECHGDGRFTVTKPAATGGLVTPAVVGEQMLYEIGDPASYLLPDVTCDFTQVTMTEAGDNRVDVQGARGHAPGAAYKVTATYVDGFRCNAQLTIVGIDAAKKARRTAEAILIRTRELFAQHGLADYSRTHIEVLGSEAGNFGPHAQNAGVREVVLHLAVMHTQKPALDLFAREIAPAGTSWSPGTTGAAGRPSPSPCIRQFAFLLDKDRLAPRVEMDGQAHAVPQVRPSPEAGSRPAASASRTVDPEPAAEPFTALGGTTAESVPLIELAFARSGDKGDSSNIGVIARRPEWLPHLRRHLTEERVAAYLGHLIKGKVTRYDVPGIHAMNFLCTQALDGGGMASLRNDPLGKGMAQILLTMPVPRPGAQLK